MKNVSNGRRNASSSQRKGSRFRLGNIFNVAYRLTQMILAFVVVGLYGQDLNRARKEHKYSDSKWVFAVVVGSLAAIYALITIAVSFFTRFQSVSILFGFEWIMVIMWTVLLGIFGNMYFDEKVEMESGIQRMKNAAVFDAVNMVLWFIMALIATLVFFRSDAKFPRLRSRHEKLELRNRH